MPDNSRQDLSMYRLEKSADDLDTARINLDSCKYNAAINRAYYSIFHAMRAVFALDNKDYSKHSAVISFFNKEYILTEQFDRNFGKIIRMAGALRNASDYEDYQQIDREEAEEIIEKADNFYQAVKLHVEQRIEPEQTNTQTLG
ncbi:MAG: HEPN domain-containing protein [Oscillospiraceae bacterium]|nr:HEPN domain-containing protein [Oscillospiraceae bacterium]